MSGLITILKEIQTVVPRIDPAQLEELTNRLALAERVFITGEGRSGFMARAFAMRLMHLGLQVYVIGETVTPSVREGDTIFAVSGSGTTAGTVRVAEQAQSVRANVLAVTTEVPP
jgi:6-phospho-3-hexuloisomerase